MKKYDVLLPLPDGNKYEVIKKYCKEYGICGTGGCVLSEAIWESNIYKTCKCTPSNINFLYNVLCEHYNMDQVELYYFIMKKSKDDVFVYKHGFDYD